MIERRHTADSEQGSALVGEAFGRYRLLGLLGQGGMGRLYMAERRGVHGFVKIVALKRILPHLAGSPQLRDMFLNEARIAARLEHPNIVATYELGEVDGKYFISMEYLPGEDLSAVSGRCQGAMPIEIAVGLAQQAAQGLQYAHDARDGQGRLIGLVHRDVSPRNIFVTYHGVVKLLDFGVVRNPTGPKSVPGIFKGKYGYCAPEQLESGRIDRRTDVFCLGIVLWECLSGVRLFDGATDADHRCGPFAARRPAQRAAPRDPAALDAIALRALARDPAPLSERARDVRRAGPVPAREEHPSQHQERGPVDRGAVRGRAGQLEKVDESGRQRRRGSPAVERAQRGRPTSDTDNPGTPATSGFHRGHSKAQRRRCGPPKIRPQPVGRTAALGRSSACDPFKPDPGLGPSSRARAPGWWPRPARRGRRAPPCDALGRAAYPASEVTFLPFALGVGLVLGGALVAWSVPRGTAIFATRR